MDGLGSYRIIFTLHHSKRFLLYKAERISDGKMVLIKTQDPSQLRDGSLGESIVKEAEAAVKLSHPHIRKGLSCFSEGVSNYLVADFAEGMALAEFLLQHPKGIALEKALEIGLSLAKAIRHANKSGEIHQNLNPYNVIIDSNNQIKVIGFGKDRPAWKHSEGNFKYALPIIYTAPEVYRGTLLHDNSDLYSWAVMMYQMLCGGLPWKVDSFMSPDEQKEQCLTRAVIMPDGEKVPTWLYGILLSCLKLDPKERIENAGYLISALTSEGEILFEEAAEEIPENVSEPDENEISIEPQIDTEQKDEDPDTEVIDKGVLDFEIEATAPLPLSIPEALSTEVSLIPEPDDELITPPDYLQEDSEAKQDIEVTWRMDSATEPVLSHEPEVETIPEAVEAILEDEASEEPDIFHSLDEEPIKKAEPELFPEEEVSAVPEVIEPISSIEPSEKEISVEEIAPQEPLPSIPKAEAEIPKKTVVPDIPKPIKKETLAPSTKKQVSEPKDLTGMQKSFKALMWASLFIIAFILVKTYVINPRQSLKLTKEEEEPIETVTDNLKENVPIQMIKVPADTLIMGSISPEADEDEFPLLTVFVPSFYISPTEITQAQWLMVYPNNPSQFSGDDLPVENVSFYDVVEFCNDKSLKDGYKPVYDYYGSDIVCDFEADGYRLPTEAEWELAAKSGNGRDYSHFSGSDAASEVAWVNSNSGARTNPVATKKSNDLGIYDLGGNVYEWVWNWYAPYTFRIPNLLYGPENGTDKVIRGGSWYHPESESRISNRDYAKPYTKKGYIGFRVVRKVSD